MLPAPLAAAVLAATSLGTAVQHPLIEVYLRKLENRTHVRFEFCSVLKVSAIKKIIQKPALVTLDQGDYDANLPVYSQQNKITSFCSNLRVISGREPIFLDFQFNFYDCGAFQLACVRSQLQNDVTHINTLLDHPIRWDLKDPPQYMCIEIDATILQEDLRNTIFEVLPVKKEKIL